MKLGWKYGRLSFISFLKSSIPFHSGIFHIPYRNFRSIPFHTMPWFSILQYIVIIIVTFYPMVVARLKIRKRLILKKLLPLPTPFQHLRFRVRFQPLSSKCFRFRFHKKLTASASTSLSRTVGHC